MNLLDVKNFHTDMIDRPSMYNTRALILYQIEGQQRGTDCHELTGFKLCIKNSYLVFN